VTPTDPSPSSIRPAGSGHSRRRWLAQAAAVGAAGLSGCAARGPRSDAEATGRRSQVVPFSELSAPEQHGALPDGWAPYALRPDRKTTDYSLAQREGRPALLAQARASSTAVQCAVDIEPASEPWLHWSWCADRLIEGARVDDDDCDDAVARLVLAFDGDLGRLSLRDFIFFEQVQLLTGKTLPYASLLYVWDGVLPVGTVVNYPRSSRIKYLVVESGAQRLGRWIDYRRNVVEDHWRAFGEPPGRVSAVGCFTDGDDLKADAQAWYGDISFRR
jgi:Protein of unknown function (DUF3047)